ncbi:MAG: tol-pal system-associated acyl-CoA thioesterase [Pseudomonadota bacterium]
MHAFSLRVYYEDTDLAGIVYYANYLKFIERGRTEALRAAGIDQVSLKVEAGLVFVVRSLSAEYLVPARFDDLLTVETAVVEIGRASLTVAQAVRRGAEDKPLFTATVRLAVTDAAGRPRRLPEAIAASLSSLGGGAPS